MAGAEAAEGGVRSPPLAGFWVAGSDRLRRYVIAADKKSYLQEDIGVFDFELTAAEVKTIDEQRSCQAGQPKPCAGAGCECWPYWPGPEDCCNVDGKGGHCKAW